MTATKRIDGADVTKTFLAIQRYLQESIDTKLHDSSFTLNHGTGVMYRIWADTDSISISQWTEGLLKRKLCTEISVTMVAVHHEEVVLQRLLPLVVTAEKDRLIRSPLSELIEPQERSNYVDERRNSGAAQVSNQRL